MPPNAALVCLGMAEAPEINRPEVLAITLTLPREPRCRQNKLQRGGALELDNSSKTHLALILLVDEFYN